LAIDLFCGLGGWTEGLLAEGYRVVGFDIERHVYGSHRYPAQLVLQDVLTIHGGQFKSAALIVASPPCQEFSYMAMPWSKAKQKIREYEDGTRDVKRLTALFDACFRIQCEASEAAGRYIPLIVENVRGAQRWVGRSRWNFGSFHLWGDVPALMPITVRRSKQAGNFHRDGTGTWNRGEHIGEGVKVPTMGAGWYPPGHPKHVPGLAFNGHADRHIKNSGGSWFNVAHNTTSGKGNNPDGRKGSGGTWFTHGDKHWKEGACVTRLHNSKSHARRAAAATIAKIPFVLSRHIAAAWHPGESCI